mmetsp:Transcript_18615/g.26210  ORF Transcript_18615/g.26210 Transcript_18615/m.26210 type:complete len:106 (-) Transcript_18615:449-766(-)
MKIIPFAPRRTLFKRNIRPKALSSHLPTLSKLSFCLPRFPFSSFVDSVPTVVVLPEVSEAIARHDPVVALESTILAHGLPYPENIELASDISHILRSKVCFNFLL